MEKVWLMAFISVITLRRFTLIKVSYAVLYSNSNSSNGGLVKSTYKQKKLHFETAQEGYKMSLFLIPASIFIEQKQWALWYAD